MEGIEAAPGRVLNPGAVLKTGMRIEGRVETTAHVKSQISKYHKWHKPSTELHNMGSCLGI